MQWYEFDPGKVELAASLARKAVKRKPSSVANWTMLGRALLALGEFEQAKSCLRDAATVLPSSAEIQLALVETLMAQGLFEEALLHAEAARALAPEEAEVKGAYFNVLAALRHWHRIAVEVEDTDAFSATDHRMMKTQAKSLGVADTLRMCDAQLHCNPAHTNAKYLKSIALASLGRAEEARELMGLDRLLRIRDLELPAGYPSSETFRHALATEIRSNPTLMSDPRGTSTRDGLQTSALRQPQAVATETLLVQIRRAVDDYEEWLVASGEALGSARPRKARLQSWAVIQRSTGRQKAHSHPYGWISGVYYVTAPRAAGDGAWAGFLLAGALDPDEHGIEPPWGVRRIDPVPGRLVLFPSYMPHATEASGVDAERICVAFDVAPV